MAQPTNIIKLVPKPSPLLLLPLSLPLLLLRQTGQARLARRANKAMQRKFAEHGAVQHETVLRGKTH